MVQEDTAAGLRPPGGCNVQCSAAFTEQVGALQGAQSGSGTT